MDVLASLNVVTGAVKSRFGKCSWEREVVEGPKGEEARL